MKLLVLSQYFWPESFIINDLAKTLRDLGHQVVVATGKPNYPEGRIYSGYRAAGVQHELFDNSIEVWRVPLRPRGDGALNRFLNYCSFVWSGLRWFPRLLRSHQFDAILVFAVSPITMAIPAIALRRQKKAHLAIWVQDLWPESLSATGFVRNRALLALVGAMVRAIYRRADTILAQSPAFIDAIAKYAPRDKIVYYANSVRLADDSDEELVLDSRLLDTLNTAFCVVFTGNIGAAQAVDTMIDAASRLRDVPDVKLVLVGSGSMLAWAERRCAELRLDNVVLTGRLPVDLMPKIYRHASCLLVSLKRDEIFSYTVPAKLQGYLAAGRPVIASLNGEGARIVEEAGAGMTCPAEDADALATCIRRMRSLSESQRAALGAAGRRYFLEHFEMRAQGQHLVEILEQRMRQTAGSRS